jgi:hypothetical protein
MTLPRPEVDNQTLLPLFSPIFDLARPNDVFNTAPLWKHTTLPPSQIFNSSRSILDGYIDTPSGWSVSPEEESEELVPDVTSVRRYPITDFDCSLTVAVTGV